MQQHPLGSVKQKKMHLLRQVTSHVMILRDGKNEKSPLTSGKIRKRVDMSIIYFI